MLNNTAGAVNSGRASPLSGSPASGNTQNPTMSPPEHSQLPSKTAAGALMAGNVMMLGAGSDQDDPIPFEPRTIAATSTESHPLINDLISSASSSLSNSTPGPQSLSSMSTGLPPGFPVPIGHTKHGGLGGGMPQSAGAFPSSHQPMQHQHLILRQHGLSGSATYHAFHNAGLSSPSPSTPGATSSYLGSAMSNPAPPLQYSPQYAYRPPLPPPPPQIHQCQQQQQQVVVLLPSTAKIDRLQFAQLVSTVSSALQRPVEFKDLLMTVAPTSLVVMESEAGPAVATRSVLAKVDTADQGVMVGHVECAASGTQTSTAKCVSIETQTEDSDMLRAILDKAADASAIASNEQESVVWFNKSDLVKHEQPAASSSRRDSSCSSSGSTAATAGRTVVDDPLGAPTQSTSSFSGWGDERSSPTRASRSASQRPAHRTSVSDPWADASDAADNSSSWPEVPPPASGPQPRAASLRHPPLQAATNWNAQPSHAPSQPPAPRSQSLAPPNPSPGPPSLATSRLGARGLRPSSLLASPPPPPTSTPRTSSPASFPAGPPRPLPTRPHLSNVPTLPPVSPPEINHPLSLVTRSRPANSGPAPFHVTLRNLRSSVTPRDLLYLARDLRSLVKVYYPPHAFFSFVGRAAVFFLEDKVEAVEFARWMQGQIARGKLRVVYELTEADLREAWERRGLDTDKLRGWQTVLAVTAFRPGVGKRAARSQRDDVVDGIDRGVRERMAAGERELAEQSMVAEASETQQDGGGGGEKEEVDAGDWKQWEADMCRLFDDEIAASGKEDDAAIEWVNQDDIAALQGKTAREPLAVRKFARMWQETAPDA